MMKRRRHPLDDLEEDIRDHIERETRDLIEAGMPPEEAQHAAIRKFGNITRVAEETRAVWTWAWVEQLRQDVRYGWRMLRRNPGFAAVAVATLALGIGMNTAVFSVVNAVLLRPLDCPHPERLVWLADHDPQLKRDVVASPDFLFWREHARSYTAMAAYGPQQAAVAADGAAQQVSGVVVAGDFWALTGARPALGRLFGPREQDRVVLTWDLFARQFGADPALIGKSVLFDGRAATVSGVLPRAFRFQFPMWWQAIEPQPVEAYFPLPAADIVRFRSVNVAAALKPGARIAQAQAELAVLEQRAQQRRSADMRFATNLHIEPLAQKLNGAARPALFILAAAGALVLLIACLNIANLLLVRATVRQREIAIRAAVGAGRGRVIRQLLAESLTLALAGGAAGVALARGALAVLVRVSPNAAPRLAEATIDSRVLLFTAAAAIVTGMLFGSGPAFALWRANLHDSLKEGARASCGPSGLRLRRLLVAGELALAIVLLVGAGLLVKGYWRMHAYPSGFAPESIVTMKVRLAGPQYNDREKQEAYMRELLRRVESAPGVRAAGVSNWFLFDGVPFPSDTKPGQTHVIRLNASSPGYLKALGVRLMCGRWLTEADAKGGAVLLNESMAREAFGARDPIGRQILTPGPATVVGVVSEVKYAELDADPPAEIYIPHQQLPFLRGTDVVVRAKGDPAEIAPEIRKLIAGIDPSQPVYDLKTLARALSDSIAPRRFHLFLLGTFAAAALLVALVGIYGVIAYSVAERTLEIGVRMALGAQRHAVVGMVVREGVSMALAGIATGLAGAWLLTREMASLLYNVRPNDPGTFAAVAAALGAAAILACWAPALKAARVDPLVALRYE
ncbi:MAG TPA: ABC transporter permease [Bryobacteraceae bacterium]|nr:ABC transporter permease [Bryobacteraceae bacterium]